MENILLRFSARYLELKQGKLQPQAEAADCSFGARRTFSAADVSALPSVAFFLARIHPMTQGFNSS